MAKSNMDFEFGGGDFSGVIAPVKPVAMEGIKLGRPISNYSKKHVEIIAANLSRSIVLVVIRTLYTTATIRCAIS
jgi:hypothetical protein